MEPSDAKHCPLCNLDLPIGEFGICRSRKDGRNLYCKSCIRKKVTEGRRALREYKSARKRYVDRQVFIPETLDRESVKPIWRLTPVERVKEAIQNGARTQREIGQQTKLGKDEIGDAIANLLLWTHEIRTQIVDGTRLYFINEVEEIPEIDERGSLSWTQVLRKANAPTVQGERRVRRVA